MKKLLYILSLLLLQATAASLLAQDKPKAGDLIQGVVTDSVSPLMAVYITELDSADRTVAYAYTDLKGEFSFSLVNPKDRIQFSYYRKERIVLPIDKTYFEIRMQEDKSLPPVSWEDFAPLDSRDVRDAAKSPVLIDVSEYESLGLYTIDDIFNAKTGLDLPWLDDTDIIHGYVDLGLSVKWATCNVGADKPGDLGDYYAWGELEPKESYTWENYRFGVGEELPFFKSKLSKYNTDRNRGVVDNKTTLDLVDDVANVRWGGSWRMPTLEEWTELRQNCTWTVDSINGVKGLRATSNKPGYTDRSIFLPEADYWSSSLHELAPLDALGIPIGEQKLLMLDLVIERERGCPVRPVHP
jgi:hypothetical protein